MRRTIRILSSLPEEQTAEMQNVFCIMPKCSQNLAMTVLLFWQETGARWMSARRFWKAEQRISVKM